MRVAYLFVMAVLIATPPSLIGPVQAQSPEPDQAAEGFAEGLNLLGEGARLMLRGLHSELAPMLEALGAAMDDVNAYEMPEVLENGDILIRRKPAPEPTDDDASVVDL